MASSFQGQGSKFVLVYLMNMFSTSSLLLLNKWPVAVWGGLSPSGLLANQRSRDRARRWVSDIGCSRCRMGKEGRRQHGSLYSSTDYSSACHS